MTSNLTDFGVDFSQRGHNARKENRQLSGQTRQKLGNKESICHFYLRNIVSYGHAEFNIRFWLISLPLSFFVQ